MSRAAPRPCTYPGCRALVRDGSGRCDAHRNVERKRIDAERGSAHERGYTSAWQRARAAYLKAHPLCVVCKEQGRVEAAEVVDHIVPPRLKDALDSGDAMRIERAKKLFWDSNNWQALSKRCHDRKTALEDSTFARRPLARPA